MRLTGKKDIRVRRTLQSIRKAFEELICEKDYDAITVTELAERAMLNKKTFYQYYPTLDDLLREVQMELATEYADRVRGLGLRDWDRLVREFYLFSEEKGPFYEKITRGNHYSGIRQTMMNEVARQTSLYPEIAEYDEPARKILEAYMSAAMLEIYKQWIEDGKRLSVERIIEMTTRLISKGIEDYVK